MPLLRYGNGANKKFILFREKRGRERGESAGRADGRTLLSHCINFGRAVRDQSNNPGEEGEEKWPSINSWI